MSLTTAICRRYVLRCSELEKSETHITNHICANHSICCDLPDKSNIDSQSTEKSCMRDNISVCQNNLSSTCHNASTESNSLSNEQEDNSIYDTKESSASIWRPLSACYNMPEKSDPLVKELLEQLSRTRYTNESRRHWEMMVHCERAAFPRAALNLPLPSREGRFYWHLYSTAMKNSHPYQKQVNHALLVTLAKLLYSQKSKRGMSVWAELIRLQTFDRIGRKNLITRLERLLYKQIRLESICLEGLSLTPDEGVRLLLALYNSRKTMRHVYCWHAFEKMVGLTVDPGHHEQSRFYTNKEIKICDWFRAIGCLEFLTTLSVNYAYIATPTGDLLVSLAKKLGTNWHWLQLLCSEEEIIQKAEDEYDIEKVVIPDSAWRAAHFWAPVLKVQYAIIGIPRYDVHKKFFTKHTRIHTFALSTSIDLKFRQPWYLDCTIKTLCTWYSDTLVYLSLQLWHNRQNLDDQLRRLFIYLPSLRVFEYIGEIRTLKTLCAMCCQIRSGHCNVYRVNMQLQDVNGLDKEKWIKSIRCMMACFKCDFDRMGVEFNIEFYCC
ncbi:uncharacterized protein LOC117210339 [Bombus bifarius]|uniref:Uncharacterized protein LOC117210339 n=1 Tax=Bombus bifarius TaxID=103933 RepID=A0A6P8M6F1_9HYME|nr:uncharacterized protein LOC117210339 [Bombus bifarius]